MCTEDFKLLVQDPFQIFSACTLMRECAVCIFAVFVCVAVLPYKNTQSFEGTQFPASLGFNSLQVQRPFPWPYICACANGSGTSNLAEILSMIIGHTVMDTSNL